MNQAKNLFRLTKTPWMAAGAILVSLLTPTLARSADDKAVGERLQNSGDVLKELINSHPGIPQNLLNTAECVIVLPSVKKAGFIVGAQYGRGAMSCRGKPEFTGPWSAPILMQSSGGSFGLQAGGQATDFVILVMNDKGARNVLNGKVKLGGEASVAAGPVGRDAEAATTGSMSAQMLSYSRAQGVFAGVSLSGTTLAPDGGANENIYGKKVSGQEIYDGAVQAPPSAETLLSTLNEKSPKNVSKGKP